MQVKVLLTKNRDKLEQLAKRLLEVEIVEREELNQILGIKNQNESEFTNNMPTSFVLLNSISKLKYQ